MTDPSAAFSPQVTRLLDCAAELCTRRGTQLTALRRSVLGLVIGSDLPAGAYDLLRRLSHQQARTAPPTVYRALDFLIAEGLVHKVTQLSAYVACTRHLHHDHDHPAHGQSVQFLICTSCGRATELEDSATLAALRSAGSEAGFCVQAAVIEASGQCRVCLTSSSRA